MSARALTRRLGRVGTATAHRWRPAPADPTVDPSRLTAEELEAMAGLRERIDAVGLSGLTDEELDLGECLSRKVRGENVGVCVPAPAGIVL